MQANGKRGGIAKVPISITSSKGFTLLEVLVAMIIMLVGLLGLLQAIIVASESNAKNLLRDEVVQLSDNYMNSLKSRSFYNSTTSYPVMNIKSKVRGGNVNYAVTMASTPLGENTRKVSVSVDWRYKEVNYNNEIISLRTR